MNSSDPITTWIIEDDREYSQTIYGLLEETDDLHCSETFTDCETAIDYLKLIPQSQIPEVILLDINLPGLDGIQGIGVFKSIAPQIVIVMLTIRDDPDTIYNALRAGASGYLLKNARMNEITDAIRVAKKGGMLMISAVASKVQNLFLEMGPKVDYGLSSREKDVLALMVKGYAQKKIAEELFIATNTVNTHIQHIYEKLHVHSNIEAVAKAVRERIVN